MIGSRWMPASRYVAMITCALTTVPVLLSAQGRLPAIPPDRLTADQQHAVAEFAEARMTGVFGPFIALLRSPEVMLRAMAMGSHVRFNSSIPAKLNELAILITAREWSQSYEWNAHAPAATRAGLSAEIIDAIAQGRRPENMTNAEDAVYAFCTELHWNKGVSDRTYARTVEQFGEQGAIDLVAASGYYTLIAMALNTARTPLPESATPLLPLPR